MAVAVLLVDMGTTAFNIYYDDRRGVDLADFERKREKVLVYEGVAPGAAFLTASALFAGAGIFGLVIALLTGVEILIAGATVPAWLEYRSLHRRCCIFDLFGELHIKGCGEYFTAGIFESPMQLAHHIHQNLLVIDGLLETFIIPEGGSKKTPPPPLGPPRKERRGLTPGFRLFYRNNHGRALTSLG